MGRRPKSKKAKAARDARVTQDFFSQVPESSMPAATKSSSATDRSALLPTSSTPTFDEESPGATLPNQFYNVLVQIGRSLFDIHNWKKEPIRDEIINWFKAAYSSPSSALVDAKEWRIETEVILELAQAILYHQILGLQVGGPEGGVLTEKSFISAPSILSEFDVISYFADHFFDCAKKAHNQARLQPNSDPADLTRPFYLIGLIKLAATVKLDDPELQDTDPQPLEDYKITAHTMASPNQNLFIDYTANHEATAKGTASVMGTGAATNGSASVDDATAGVEKLSVKEGKKPQKHAATTATTATTNSDPKTTTTIVTATPCMRISTHRLGATRHAATVADGSASAGPGPATATRAARNAAIAATSADNTEASAEAGPSTETRPRLPRVPMTPTQAQAKINRYLESLVNKDYPSTEARRAAFARARQRLLRSETLAVARGEQAVRLTATRASQEALTIGRDDALNAARQQRAAQGGAGAGAGGAREYKFDIGGMPGWAGELEAMQIMGLRRSAPKEDNKEEKQENKGKGKEKADK